MRIIIIISMILIPFLSFGQIDEFDFITGKQYNELLEIIKSLENKVNELSSTETGILFDLKQGKDFDFISENYSVTEIREFAESKDLESKGNPDDVLTEIFEWFKKQ